MTTAVELAERQRIEREETMAWEAYKRAERTGITPQEALREMEKEAEA